MTLPPELKDMPPSIQSLVAYLVQRVERLSSELSALKSRRAPAATERERGQGVFDFAVAPLSSEAPAAAANDPREPAKPHGRRPAAEHLPRERREYHPPQTDRICSCGRERMQIGEEKSTQYEYIPASLRVIEHARIKYACSYCKDSVVVGPLPEKVIDKGLAGPGLLAHIVTSKYADHQPLYRQEDILARHGVEIPRSTQCQWVERVAQLLSPLYECMRAEVLQSNKIHTDDTTVQMLAPGSGKTRTVRLWTYVGDDEHAHDLYEFTLSRNRDGPATFLKGYKGYLQADAYGGYDGLYLSGAIKECACWAHARRKFEEALDTAPRALEMLALIRELYDVERRARGNTIRIRHDLRALHSAPLLRRIQMWLQARSLDTLPKSPLGQAVHYCLRQWRALNRYLEDGILEPDNNAAERALRSIAIGRKNWLFFGNENGGRRAAILYSLIGSCKRHGHDPFVYLRDVLVRVSHHPASRVMELTPAHWRPTTN